MSNIQVGDVVAVSDVSPGMAAKCGTVAEVRAIVDYMYVVKTDRGLALYPFAVKTAADCIGRHNISADLFLGKRYGIRCPLCNRHIHTISEAISDDHFAGYVRKDGTVDYQHCRDEQGNLCVTVLFEEGDEE